MGTSLAVPSRHLALPDCACFSPVALEINESCTQDEFSRIGAALVALDTADGLWTCDLAQYAVTRWGAEKGIELCSASTGYTKGTCKKLGYVAQRFAPSIRPDGWTRAHFKSLLPFPQDWLNTWIPSVSNRKLSASGIRALAIEAFGSDPSQRQVRKKRSVSIPSTLYARLVEINPTQPSALVTTILEEWLRRQSGNVLTQAEKQRRYRANHPGSGWNAEQYRDWRAARKTAATTFHDDKQHPAEPVVDEEPSIEDIEAAIRARDAQKTPVPDTYSSGSETADGQVSPQPESPSETPKRRPGRQKKTFRPFCEARNFARSLNLSGILAWRAWRASGQKPVDIPAYPQYIYPDSWAGWPDFLGYVSSGRGPRRGHGGRPRGSSKRASAEKKPEVTEPIREPADIAFQLDKFNKQAAASRPTYEQRREQQIADGAKKIEPKPERNFTIRVQYTECKGDSYIDSENGAEKYRVGTNNKPTKFYSEADAIAAEEAHAKECGYREKVVHCPSCSLKASGSRCIAHVYHVAHIFSGAQRKKPSNLPQSLVNVFRG